MRSALSVLFLLAEATISASVCAEMSSPMAFRRAWIAGHVTANRTPPANARVTS